MPIYSYRCNKCKHIEEIGYGMMEDKPKEIMCPKCKKGMMTRVYGEAKTIIPLAFKDETFDFTKRNKKKYY